MGARLIRVARRGPADHSLPPQYLALQLHYSAFPLARIRSESSQPTGVVNDFTPAFK